MSFHFGYIDAGSGSVIWQAAVGGILGGAYIVRTSIGRIIDRTRAAFSKNSSKNEGKPDSNN